MPKRNTPPEITPPIPSCGEFFADRALIDLVRAEQNGSPQLALWDGKKETVGSDVQHNGHRYVPGLIDFSVLRELGLPSHCRPHGTTRELLTQICKLITGFVGLDAKSAAIIGRVVLCSHLIEALLAAPAVMVIGPHIARGNQLMALLRCLCRHSLSLTGVTPAGFCSLASGAKFTYLISQEKFSDKLLALLNDASRRDRKIPFRGRLLDLFGVQVVHTVGGGDRPLRAIPISMIPSDRELPAFDLETQRQITEEFQAKLLSFRRTNFAAARSFHFDASKFPFPLRDLACSLAAATPDDPPLQNEVFELLQDMDKEIRSENWVDLNAIATESLLVVCKENASTKAFARVSDLAQIAHEILNRRGGEEAPMDVGQYGKRLKFLGFTTERDARGKKLRLTEAGRNRAQQLARNLRVAGSGDESPGDQAETDQT